MIRLQEIRLPVDHADSALLGAVRERLGSKDIQAVDVEVFQRAVDARKATAVYFNYTVDVRVPAEMEVAWLRDERRAAVAHLRARPSTDYTFLQDHHFRPGSQRPLVIGTGPSGLFAGLLLARMGLRPILLERGKMAGPRARDVTRFWRTGAFEPDSNVQFGEGGAGTFSDGKLYTQIKDRGNHCRYVLQELADHGAPGDILVNSRPHIGTDRLIKVLRALRETILELGGEMRFESRVTDLLIDDQGTLQGVVLSDGTVLETQHAVLAVGHSARDVFEMLVSKGIPMEPKPFSVGVRVEHPQALVDATQYGRYAGHPRLGSAAYRFVHHGKGRSVYSFCMCPGGLVVAAASEPGRLVTNGMSAYARDQSNANSGFMVEIKPEDFPGDDPLAGIRFQRDLEERAFLAGGSNYHAPAQLLGDFLKQRPSTTLGDVEPSYRPGVVLGDLRECLPAFIATALREAIKPIARRLPGFDRADAILTAVESRSSSPLRLPRGADFQSLAVKGLFPAGEGAGYAGGIVSAAVDGLKVAEAVGLLHEK